MAAPARRAGGITPQDRGRYPGYDVLAQASHWDERTRAVVLARVSKPPPIRFFSPAEALTLDAFCDVATGQDGEPRIPVLAFVDAKLYEGRLDGFQFADMPDDRDTWRLVARALDEAARERREESFAATGRAVQKAIVGAFAAGELRGGVWDELPIQRAWSVVMRAVLAAFYSHPWAWNEIGFGGPAYPRGYATFATAGSHEWWEAPAENEAATGTDAPTDGGAAGATGADRDRMPGR